MAAASVATFTDTTAQETKHANEDVVDWENTPVLSWMHPVFTGRAISARGGHCSVLVGNLLITFGGHFFGKDKFEYVQCIDTCFVPS